MKILSNFRLALIGSALLFANSLQAQFTSGGAGKTILTNINDLVGIGTVSPNYRMDVRGSGIQTLSLKSTNNNSSLLLDRGNSSSTSSVTYKNAGVNVWQTGIIANDNYNIRNQALNASAITVLASNNNVGIGTASPSQKLHIVGNILATGNLNVADIIATGIVSNAGVISTGNISAVNYTGSGNLDITGYIGFSSVEQFSDGGSNTIASNSNITPTVDCGANLGTSVKRWNNILACGNLGIGTTAPISKIQIVGGTDANLTTGGYIILGDISGLSTSIDNNEIMARNNNLASNLFLNRIGGNVILNGNGAGNVGIGNSAPAFQLQLSLNSAAKPGSSSWTVPSDGRLKKDVKIFTDGLDVLDKINPVWFTYTGEAGLPANEIAVGTIAQELLKFAPYMVNEWTYKNEESNTDQKYLGVDYGPLDFILVNSIKEQQKKIVAKDAEVENQKAINIAQQNQIEELKSDLKQMQNDLSQCCISFSQKSAKGINDEGARLEQNSPNPFSQSTIIRFYIPQNFTTAQVKVYSSLGDEMKSVEIKTSGIGQVEISGSSMAAGIYQYILMIDGKTIDNKQMILTK